MPSTNTCWICWSFMAYSQVMSLFVERKFSNYHPQVSWLMYNTFIEHTNIMQHAFNKTYEEEFGEQGSIVPYKVELADANSQQR